MTLLVLVLIKRLECPTLSSSACALVQLSHEWRLYWVVAKTNTPDDKDLTGHGLDLRMRTQKQKHAEIGMETLKNWSKHLEIPTSSIKQRPPFFSPLFYFFATTVVYHS